MANEWSALQTATEFESTIISHHLETGGPFIFSWSNGEGWPQFAITFMQFITSGGGSDLLSVSDHLSGAPIWKVFGGSSVDVLQWKGLYVVSGSQPMNFTGNDGVSVVVSGHYFARPLDLI